MARAGDSGIDCSPTGHTKYAASSSYNNARQHLKLVSLPELAGVA
jgi:hypothetical protein